MSFDSNAPDASRAAAYIDVQADFTLPALRRSGTAAVF
jgi:hypothetical protein